MLTVQEIQSMTFEKAVFGGYDMKSVNDVMAQIVEDYGELQKENATLKAKMKVLVDKVDEYRNVEDGMRRALVSAQSIAQETLTKATSEAEQIRSEAENTAAERMGVLNAQIADCETRLDLAKRSNAEFLAKITAVYDAQMKVLVKLAATEELQPAAPAASAEGEEPEAAPQEPVPVAEFEEPAPAAEKSEAETLHEQATARFDFGELKFGSDYKPENEQ